MFVALYHKLKYPHAVFELRLGEAWSPSRSMTRAAGSTRTWPTTRCSSRCCSLPASHLRTRGGWQRLWRAIATPTTSSAPGARRLPTMQRQSSTTGQERSLRIAGRTGTSHGDPRDLACYLRPTRRAAGISFAKVPFGELRYPAGRGGLSRSRRLGLCRPDPRLHASLPGCFTLRARFER
jgi:hypothetical protein